jgi:phosphate-selective porin OprO and OprP
MKTKTILRCLSICPLLFAASAWAEEPDADRISALESRIAALEAADEAGLNGRWKNGFVFEDAHKEFQLKVGGRVQLDTAFFDADDALETEAGSFDDGIKFRRSRLSVSGTLYENMEFMAEYDFAGGVDFQSVFLGFKNLPVIGNLRIGHLYEPVGLEGFGSNNTITFMERGLNYAFNPVYNTGAMAFDHALDKRMTWQAGIFKDTGSMGDSVSNEEFAVSARLTGLPYISGKGDQYLHLGGSFSHRGLTGSGYRARTRPQSIIAPVVVDTGSIDADEVGIVTFESALTMGSVSLQGEWSMASADTGGDDPEFTSWYVMASYFLTGEHRPYSAGSGTIGRVKPRQNAVGKDAGLGAWEIAARYDTIDLDDGAIEGGVLDTITLGLNWYLHPHSRIMFNYVLADVEDVGEVDIAQMRFQFDF